MAIQLRLEEVDLGTFRVTMPQPPESIETALIEFHAFGRVANRHLKNVTALLEERSAELKHRTLLAVREMNQSALQETDLETLRTQILAVYNDVLPDEPMHSVGFYKFTFSDH